MSSTATITPGYDVFNASEISWDQCNGAWATNAILVLTRFGTDHALDPSQNDQHQLEFAMENLYDPYQGLVFHKSKGTIILNIPGSPFSPSSLEWATLYHRHFRNHSQYNDSLQELREILGFLIRVIHSPNTVCADEIERAIKFLSEYRMYLKRLRRRLINEKREFHFQRKQEEAE